MPARPSNTCTAEGEAGETRWTAIPRRCATTCSTSTFRWTRRYISLDAAGRDYGVVFTGSLDDYDLEVDAAATVKLRASRRDGRVK
jgi:hypothetical protein